MHPADRRDPAADGGGTVSGAGPPLTQLLRAVRPVKPGGQNDEQEERRHAEQWLPRDEERDAAYYARRENQALTRHGVHARTSAPVPPM